MNTAIRQLVTATFYTCHLTPLSLTATFSTRPDRHSDASSAASHYRSAIPFKAQFVSEKVKSTLGDTTTRERLIDSTTHPQRHHHATPVSHLSAAVTNIPNPKKRQTGGEDSWTVCTTALTQSGQTEQITVLAVFDGVGSWAVDKDINAALFSRQLSTATEAIVKEHTIALTPSAILQHVWDDVCANKIRGGSTACILTHRHDAQQVQCANLGDSGFIVLRPSNVLNEATGAYEMLLKIAFHSTFQWHYFNCPLQLGIDIDHSTDHFDAPSAADVFSVQVQVGDIIVLSTDGLFDNIDDDEFVQIVQAAYLEDKSAQYMSRVLAEAALAKSADKMIDTPFSVMAREENILWRGGRPDDITVVVANVE